MENVAESTGRGCLPQGPALGGRRFRLLILSILLLAGVWRLALATAMPCISRDGARYCAYARDLGRQGLSLLAGDKYQQHPLFPAGILAVQRAARYFGSPDTPMTWQRAGQGVAWLSGMCVVVLCGWLTLRLVELAGLPVEPRRAALVAMLLAGVLPLNTWHSADVMSDELHLLFYLAGVVCLLKLERWWLAAACGLFSGLAFLTRPEGITVCIAGLLVLASQARTGRPGRAAGLAALLVSGFLVCAAPYWAVSGKLSPKLQKEALRGASVTGQAARAAPEPAPAGLFRAALLRQDVAWYAVVPQVLYVTFRAGRVVIVLLALPVLIGLRREFGRSPLVGPAACAGLHVALAAVLLGRYGYLDPRHMLVVVALLISPAAVFLLQAGNELRRRGRQGVAVALALGSFLPLAFYSLRVPNGADAFVARAGRWLARHDEQAGAKLLLGGSSERRVAFYADTRFQPWPENEADPELRFEALRRHLLDIRPDYFAIESGPGRERAGNAELLARLWADERIAGRMRRMHEESDGGGGALHLLALDWPGR